MERYSAKKNGFPAKRKPGFQPNHPKMGGRKKGTPNKVPGDLLTAIVEACTLVGYDRDVYKRKVVINKDGTKEWVEEINEKARIQGLIPYIKRTAELHRKEMLTILGKIVTPAVVQLVMMNNNVETTVQVNNPTVEDLKRELSSMGVSLSLFHGDPGREPITIDNDLLLDSIDD